MKAGPTLVGLKIAWPPPRQCPILNLTARGWLNTAGSTWTRQAMLAVFESWQGWLPIALAALVVLVAVLDVLLYRLRAQKLHLSAALDHMQQGLCVYDSAERLILCNKRYVEMYGFSSDVVHPGCTLLDVLEHRVALGTLSGNAA